MLKGFIAIFLRVRKNVESLRFVKKTNQVLSVKAGVVPASRFWV